MNPRDIPAATQDIETPPKYRSAIIGLGFIGAGDQVSGDALGQRVEHLDGTHLLAHQGNDRVELVAGSSRDSGRRERFAARTGLATFSDWREMLSVVRPEIVSVATYAPQHAEIVVACAEQGVRAIYCEKPLATTLSDADRMLQACSEAGTLLAVNHNRRFHPVFRRLRQEVAKGTLGELTGITTIWGSGRLGNVGTHMFNAICMVANRRVEAVSAALDDSRRPDCRGSTFRDPGGWGMLRLNGGLIATFHASDYSTAPAVLTIYGKLAYAVVEGDQACLHWPDGRIQEWQSPPRDTTSMDQAMRDITNHLDGIAEFPDASENSRHTLEIIIACHASHQRRSMWTDIPLTGADRDIEVHSG